MILQPSSAATLSPRTCLSIVVVYAPPLRVWHLRLVDRLAAGGHRARLQPGSARARAPLDIRLLLALERVLYGARSSLFRRVGLPAAGAPCDTRADLAIQLDGPLEDGRSLHVRFDGQPGERALVTALLAGRAPVVTVCSRDGGSERVLAGGHPALADRHVLARSLDDMLARVIGLLVRAVDGRAADLPFASPCLGSSAEASLIFAARGFATKIEQRWGIALRRPSGWRLAYRMTDEPGTAAAKAWPSSGFLPIPSDRARFYADPFPFEHDGRSYVFFEDFHRATQKGVIAAVEVDRAGAISPPCVVLEQPVHLSYPLLLRHEDGIYMLPEMSAARRLQLFRADPFPDRWVADRVLLDDAAVADATPILHEGLWWLFAVQNDDGGTSWDQLHLYHAPDLFGPWTPHAGNPVLVDAGSARPAGAMWHEDGALMRVAQDCRMGYGRGLAICRVDRLDIGGFAQTVVARLDAPSGTGAYGVHTLNRAGPLEVIDLKLTPD